MKGYGRVAAFDALFHPLERMKTKVRCSICPKGCELALGGVGDCRVRKNIDGEIRCTTYGYPCALNVDPIEKKPLYHFLPGSPIFSIATAGCNLHCAQCQNWQLSQSAHFTSASVKVLPGDIAEMARERGCPAIAYTYTEPLVSFEYTRDCCKAAAGAGIRNVLVTAAYINPEPLREICGARLAPVLKALSIMKECGVMLEVTNLIIPALNDSEEETKQLCGWVAGNLGVETPLHFSRFFPQNGLKHLPSTPEETLLRAREIAKDAGMQFVYVGNMRSGEGENTDCPNCGKPLIERQGYTVRKNRIADGKCPACQTPVPGVWK